MVDRATLVDINEDGWLDIYVSNSGPTNDGQKLANQLYVNNQDGTFTEQAEAYGIADASRTTQSSFFDMDNDGDLDLIVMNHSLRNREGNAVKWSSTFAALDPRYKNRTSIPSTGMTATENSPTSPGKRVCISRVRAGACYF